ncbi:uncharacterized protein LOC124663649 [Lolium rigidum]|uniref:uncharacterized protein LOC124663649 n=1 Tax=Lolium rigidum TaxID=89674 RepID=UPI001F5CA53D|nr:uncharacterized protein LOC124663649 [Lolium rigidum]
MPMPHKNKRRRRRTSPSLQQQLSRPRLTEEDGASDSLVDSDSSSRVGDGGSPPPDLPDEPVVSSPEPRYSYHEMIAMRLARLRLPDGTDGSDLPGFPSSEILLALTRTSFHTDESRAAWLEYQCQIFLSEPRGPDGESSDSPSPPLVDMGGSTCTSTIPDIGITDEEYMADCETLAARIPEIDTYHELEQDETNKLHLKHALYRIKACLLLKGKPLDELDDVELEHKYPPEFIVENNYFFHYVRDGLFGWYFDTDLCYKKYLTDYQRLVLFNDGGDEYTSWKRYVEYYSTPEADRDYLQYWETIVKELKWFEHHVLIKESSYEWAEIRSKAMLQALRIAVGFPNMTMELAAIGFHEYIWKTRINLMFVKDLDGIFLRFGSGSMRIISVVYFSLDIVQLRFRDALDQVYRENLFSAHDRSMKYELTYGDSQMELKFRKCTEGISHSVPKYKARELIAHAIRWTRRSSGTYEQYARKKLRIAELLGLISKDKIEAA